MKRLLTCIASLLFVSNLMIMAQFPDVTVPSKKYVSDIGNELMPSQDKKGKYGYKDLKGKYYIKPVFDEVTPFNKQWNGGFFAFVRHGDKWKIIKDNGEYYPNSGIEFDSKPTLTSKFAFCETNGQLNKHLFEKWSDFVPYEKLTLTDRTVFLPKNEEDRRTQVHSWRNYSLYGKWAVYSQNDNPRVESFNHNIYLLRPNRTFTLEFDAYYFNAIEHKNIHILKKSYGKFSLFDKNFNKLSDEYDYMQGNGTLVLGMNTSGDGIIYQDGESRNFKCTDVRSIENASSKSKPKTNCVSTVEQIINCKTLLDLLTKSQQTTELLQVQDNLYEILREGKYGLIDISSNLYIKPEYEYSIYNTNGRYTTEGNDIIIHDKYLYTISEYEKMRYENIEINPSNRKMRYDHSALNAYLTDTLLIQTEKIHYADVLHELDWQKQAIASFDDKLFAEMGAKQYILTKEIPNEYKKHIEYSRNIIRKQEEQEYLLLGINKPVPLLYIHPHTEETEDEKEEQTEYWNGNYYTHKLFYCNGLKLRKNAISQQIEIVIDELETPVYIPLLKPNYKEYASRGSAKLRDGRLLFAYTDYDCYNPYGWTKLFSNDNTLGYVGKDESNVTLIIADPNGNIKKRVAVAFSEKHLKFRQGYFFTNVTATEAEDGRDYKYYSEYTFQPVQTQVQDNEEKSLRSIIYIYDYNLNAPLIYSCGAGEFIHDVFKWGNKWVFVGSTINKGYIDWENPYIIVLDSKMKVLSSSYIADKGCRLNISRVSVDADNSLIINDKVKIKPNNSIEWML